MNKIFIWGSAALVAAFTTVACGDDGDEPVNPTGVNPTTSTTGGMGGATSSTSSTSSSTTSGMGGMGEGGGATGVHGCTMATAEDMTGMAAVTITTGNPWMIGHNRCILVDAGTVVTWEGNFVSHPLEGGVSPTTDDGSIITMADQSGASADVTFAAAGEFPYFCGIHTGTMQGVVYVQ